MTRFTTLNFGGVGSSLNNNPITTSDSDILLGQLFFSTTKRIKEGLLYAGETYQWSKNPKLKTLYNSSNHQYITDNRNGTFTIVNVREFIRGGTANIGSFVADTTAVNGLSVNNAGQHNHRVITRDGGGTTDGTTGQSGNGSGDQAGGFTEAAGFHNHNIVGDTETAPNHRNAYFGVYGDIAVIIAEATPIKLESAETLVGQSINSTGSTNLNLDLTLATLKADYKYLRLVGTTDRFGDSRTEEILVRTNQLVDGFDLYMEFNNSTSKFNVDANGGGNIILNNESSNAGNQDIEVWAIKEPKTIVGSQVEILDEDNLTSDSETAVATQQSIKAYVDKQVSDYRVAVKFDDDHARFTLTEPEVRAALATNGVLITRINKNSVSIAKGDIQAAVAGITTVIVRAVDGTEEDNLFSAGSVLPIGTYAVTRGFDNGTLIYQRMAPELAAILDEDDLISDSSTGIPTQQSVKAYIDNANVWTFVDTNSIDVTKNSKLAIVNLTTLNLPDNPKDGLEVMVTNAGQDWGNVNTNVVSTGTINNDQVSFLIDHNLSYGHLIFIFNKLNNNWHLIVNTIGDEAIQQSSFDASSTIESADNTNITVDQT